MTSVFDLTLNMILAVRRISQCTLSNVVMRLITRKCNTLTTKGFYVTDRTFRQHVQNMGSFGIYVEVKKNARRQTGRMRAAGRAGKQEGRQAGRPTDRLTKIQIDGQISSCNIA